MLQHPALKAHLRAGAVPGKAPSWCPKKAPGPSRGRCSNRSCRFLGGGRTPEDIVAALAPAKPAEVFYVLEFLEKRGHLAEQAPGPDGPGWGLLDGPRASIRRRRMALRSKRVRLRHAGAPRPAPWPGAWRSWAWIWRPGSRAWRSCSRTITCAAGSAALGHRGPGGRPPLDGGPAPGPEFWLGPLFPAPAGRRPCFGCLQHRLRRNQQVQEFLRKRNGWAEPLPTAVAALPCAVGAACQMAALEIAKALAGTPHNLEDHLLCMDTRTWTSTRHPLVASRRAPLRGAAPGAPRPLRLVTGRPPLRGERPA